MPTSKIFARQILGSQAFIDVVRNPSSDPAVWLFDPRRGGIAQSDVVVSAASIQQALYRARQLSASPHARMRAEATLDEVQRMANHAQITTTQLYDKRDQNLGRGFGRLIDDVLRTK